MYYSPETVDEVRSRNDIVSVISSYVKLTKKGGGYFGCCPFHNEKTPSFHVRPDRQTYHCFGCGVGGNVITFVMEYENYSFQEALKALAERAGMQLPEGEPDAEEKQRISFRQRLLDINKDAAKFYVKQLYSNRGQAGLKYFSGRGLSIDTLKKFGLGFAPSSRELLYRYLKEQGYTDEVISASGLIKITEKGTSDRFWNRVMFPIMDGNSRVIGFGGRVMGDGEPKYLNSPETTLFDKSRTLYGLHLAKRSRAGYFLLCEGYMDVISMHQAGFAEAVASLGTAFTDGHASLIARYVKEAVLTYDSDEAGIKAALRAIPILKRAGVNVRVMDLKPYKDPDEFIKALGADAFRERIGQAVNGFLFECDMARRGYDMNDPAGKTAFYRHIAAKLMAFPDELERENYLVSVAARHDIPTAGLRDMVRRLGEGYTAPALEPASTVLERRSAVSRREERKKTGLLAAQIQVLMFGFTDPAAASWLTAELSPEEFPDEGISSLAADLWPLWKAGQRIEPASLIDRYQDDETKRNAAASVASASLAEDMGSAEAAKLMKENVRRIKKHYIEAQLKDCRDAAAMQAAVLKRARLDRPDGISDPPVPGQNGGGS